MGEDRHIARHQQIKEKVLETQRRHVMRRLNQDIARFGQRQETTGPQAINKVRHNVDVGPGHETQWNVLVVQDVLEVFDRLADLGTRIVVEPRQDVGRAGDDRHAIVDRGAGHRERDGYVCGAVINARQNVAMQVDHGTALE